MKPENLQSITLEDINPNTITKPNGSGGFDGSSIIWIGLILFFLIYMLHDGRGSAGSSSSSPVKQSKSGIKLDNDEKRLLDHTRSLEMGLRSLSLKKREAEGEIRKIDMNSMSNVDIEASYENELKIDKLRMKIEEIEMMEEKKETELEEAHIKLEDYKNQNYL